MEVTRLRTWRRQNGLRQTDAAQRLGISRSYVQLVERGLRPSAAIARKIERATGLSIDELLQPVKSEGD